VYPFHPGLGDGDTDALGLTEGLMLLLIEADLVGDTDLLGLLLSDWEILADGETDADSLLLSLRLID
jgi:hypothetical protein